jgi:hypothetical protein
LLRQQWTLPIGCFPRDDGINLRKPEAGVVNEKSAGFFGFALDDRLWFCAKRVCLDG